MARFFKTLFLLAIIFLSSCEEGREAGNLRGQWRMNDTDTRYIGFSGTITVFRELGKGEVFGNFQTANDSLFIQCYSMSRSRSDTLMIEQTYGFSPFNDIRLKIESIDGANLVLSKDGKIWSFYKY